GTRHGNRERSLHGGVEGGPIHRTAQLERLLGSADASLGIDHERQLIVTTGDASVGAQLAEGEREVTRRVRRDRRRLAHDADATRPARGGESVTVREGRVGVDEPPRHHEMTRGPVGVVFTERLQLDACGAIELIRGDVVGDDGVVVPRTRVVVAGSIGARRPRAASTRSRLRVVALLPRRLPGLVVALLPRGLTRGVTVTLLPRGLPGRIFTLLPRRLPRRVAVTLLTRRLARGVAVTLLPRGLTAVGPSRAGLAVVAAGPRLPAAGLTGRRPPRVTRGSAVAACSVATTLVARPLVILGHRSP